MPYTFHPGDADDGERIYSVAQAVESAHQLGWNIDWWIDIANTLTLQTGKAPSVAHLLLDRAVVEAIDHDDYAHNIKLPSGTESSLVEFPNWVFCGAKSLDPSSSDAPPEGQILLATFKDHRHLFRSAPLLTGSGYNIVKSVVHDPEEEFNTPADSENYEVVTYFDETLNVSTPWTWTTLFQELKSLIPNGTSISLSNLDVAVGEVGGTDLVPENIHPFRS